MFKRLKSKYHLFMGKFWHEEACVLSNILGDQRFVSPAWNRATAKCAKHLAKVE